MQVVQIQNRIYELRGEKVMLDFDLAQLYEVETRAFNQAIKRNLESFPEDFMFRLTSKEWKDISSQIIMSAGQDLKSQNVISSWGGRRKLPYAFTEHGVTMAATVLKSQTARKMNIAIVRAFIALRKLAVKSYEVLALVREMKIRIDEHDVQLKSIYDTIENLLDIKAEEKSWKERERIGFKK